MAPKMRRVLASMGYNGESHIAQPYSQELADWADIIVCMEPRHQQRFAKNFDVDLDKFEIWGIIDPFKHRGEEVHKTVAKQIKEQVFHRFLD
jgi:protein-tyrosine-phosphatase